MQAINTSNSDYYSFIDFVRFRVRQLLQQVSSNELNFKFPFIGNWRKNVLKLLRGAFCAAKSSIPELQMCSKKDLINCITRNEFLKELLAQLDDRKGEKTLIYSSLQSTCQSNANGDDISWQEVHDLIVPNEDVNRPIFRHSPLNVPIFSSNGRIKSSAVHEMEVDIAMNRIYLLMLSGELYVWDAATLGTKPFLACPVVTHECSPLEVGIQDGSVTGYCSSKCRCVDDQRIIEAMFTMTPRVKILRVCSRSGVIIANSTLGDRCLRIFEPVSLRRLHRTRLDLPPSPWFDLGLFDKEEEENIAIWGNAAVEQQQQYHLPRHIIHWSSACSVLDFCYQAAQEVAVCIKSERIIILAYCCVTGLALASFPGHSASPSCILYVPSQERIITGGADRSIRVWNLESSFLSSLEHKWLPIKRKFISRTTFEGVTLSAVDGGTQCAEQPVYSDRHKQEVFPEFEVLMILREALLKNYENCPGQWRVGRVMSVIDHAEIWPSTSGGKAIPAHTGSDKRKKHQVLEILMEDFDEIMILDPNKHNVKLMSDETQKSMTDPQQHFDCFKVGTRLTFSWENSTKARKDEYVRLECEALFEGYGRTCTVNDFISAVRTLDGAPTEAQLLSIVNLFLEVKGNCCKTIVLSKVFGFLKNPSSLLEFSTTSSSLNDYQNIRDAYLSIREMISCKCVLLGHSDQVTSLTYLPVCMLLASGDAKGEIRLWDPCSSPIALSRRDPVSDVPFEMTASVKPFDCVLKMNVSTTGDNDSGSSIGQQGQRRRRIRLLFPLVLDSEVMACRILCPKSAEDSAKLLDARQDILCRAFLYLLGGEIITTEVQHFDRHLVLLDSTSFSEEICRLSSISTNMTALGAMRQAFHERSRIQRVMFCASNVYSNIIELEGVITPFITPKKRAADLLDEKVSGIFSVVFYGEGDGPTLDISTNFTKNFTQNNNNMGDGPIIGTVVKTRLDGNMVEVVLPTGKYLTVPAGSVTLLPRSNCETLSEEMHLDRGSQVVISRCALNYPPENRSRTSTSSSPSTTDIPRVCDEGNDILNNAHEMLCAEVEMPGGDVEVVGWAIGRVALNVPACEFDTPLSEITTKMTTEAFLRVWHMKCKMYREFCTYHAASARTQAISEDYIIHRNAEAIRTSVLLDREERQEIFREILIRKAFNTMLKLPLRRGLVQRTSLLYASMAVAKYDSRREKEYCSTSMLVSAIKHAARDKALPCRQYFLKRLLCTIELDCLVGRSTSGCLVSSSAALSSLSPTHGCCSTIYSALKSMIGHGPSHLCVEEAYTIFVHLGLISVSEGVNDFLLGAEVKEMMQSTAATAAPKLEDFIVLADSLHPHIRMKFAFSSHTSSAFAEISKVNQYPISYLILQKQAKFWSSIVCGLKDQLQSWNEKVNKRIKILLTYNRMMSSSNNSSVKGGCRNLGIIASSAEKTLQDAELWLHQNHEKMGEGIVVALNHVSFQQDRSSEWGIKAFACKLEESSTLNQFVDWIAPDNELIVLQVSPEYAGRTHVTSGMLFGDLLKQSVMLMCHRAFSEHPNAVRYYPLATTVGSSNPKESFHGSYVKGTVLQIVTGWLSLHFVMKTRGCLGLDKAAGNNKNWPGGSVLRLWGRQLLSLLLEIHKHTLIVQDLRPEAIFISPDGKNLKVVLGLCCCLQSRAGADVVDDNTSTFLHCSLSRDVWVFGAIMYELAFGEPPPRFSKPTLDFNFNSNSSTDVHTWDDSSSPEVLHVPTSGHHHSELFINLQPSAFERSWLKAQAHIEQQQHNEKLSMTWTDFLNQTTLCLITNKHKERLILRCIKEEEEKAFMCLTARKEGTSAVCTGERASKILNEMLNIGLTNIDMDILASVLESDDLLLGLKNGEFYSMQQRVSALLRICLIHNNNNANGSSCCFTDGGALLVSMMAVDVIKQCLELDPKCRPTVQDLIYHPFFSMKEGEEEQIYDKYLEEQTAVDYICSRGPFTLFPTTILYQKIDRLKCHLKETGIIDRRVLFEVMHGTKEIFQSRDRHVAIEEVVSSGLIEDITCFILRLQLCADADSSSLQKWDNTATTNGLVEESKEGVHQMTMLLYRLLKNVLVYLDSSSNSNSETESNVPMPHMMCAVDEFLRCTSMIYLGQEGTIPNRYGMVNTSRLGYPDTSTDRWEPSLSHIFQSLILEAIGQGTTELPPLNSLIIRLRLAENESTLHLPSVSTPLPEECSDIHLKNEEDCNHCDNPCQANDQGGAESCRRPHVYVVDSSDRRFKTRRRRFCRGFTYFNELTGLGGALCSLHQSTSSSVFKCRRGMTFIVTVIRQACGMLDGIEAGDPNVDIKRFQRAQLLVDSAIGVKIEQYLRHPDEQIQLLALEVATFALSCGVNKLRWHVKNDPHAALSLEFCSLGWVLGLVAHIRYFKGSRRVHHQRVIEIMKLMACGGDVATKAWHTAEVFRSLSSLLPDANALKVLECLSRCGSNAAARLLTNESNILFQPLESCSLELLNNVFSLEKLETNLEKLEATELLLQFNTPSEQVEIVREFAIMMCQVDIVTNRVSCDDDDDFSRKNEIFEKFISIACAWMINAWSQLERDNMNGTMMNTIHHSNLVKECFELMRMLLYFKNQEWDTMLCVTPSPKIITALLAKKQCRSEAVVSASSSGIDALCCFIGSKLHVDRQRAASQPHPLVYPVIEAIDLAGDVVSKATALEVDDSAMWLLESLSNANLGLKTGESVMNGVELQKYFQGGRENVQVAHYHGSVYARARASRLKLFDRVLATGHKALINQVIQSQVLSVAIEHMLSDIEPIGLASKEIPAAFRRLNGTPLSRGEAVELITSCYCRRSVAPDVLKEGLQCLIRANAPTTERKRCSEARTSTVLKEAITVLRIMCHMSQKISMQYVYTALQDAGVPEGLIQCSQSVSLLRDVNDNYRLWQKWLMRSNEESLDLPLEASSSYPYLGDIAINNKSVAEGQDAEMMLDKNDSEEVVSDILHERRHCMPSSCSATVCNNSIDCQDILNRLGPSAAAEVQEAFRYSQGDIKMALVQLRVLSQVAVIESASTDHLGCNCDWSFHKLLRTYAHATGLLSSTSRLPSVEGGLHLYRCHDDDDVWVESEDGRWSPVPTDIVEVLRQVFDTHITSYPKVDDPGPTIHVNNLYQVIVAVMPEIDPQHVTDYISSREKFIQEICNGQVEFAEFLRAVSRIGQEMMMRLSQYNNITGESHWMHNIDNMSTSSPGCFVTEEKRDGVHNSQACKALREAFNMYDLNRDGYITTSDIRDVFDRQGREMSNLEIEEWIRARSNNNAGDLVCFEDFLTSFLHQEVVVPPKPPSSSFQ